MEFEMMQVSVANSTAGDDVKKVVEKEGTREERSGLVSCCTVSLWCT